jgi:dUTP pyrophosphatase
MTAVLNVKFDVLDPICEPKKVTAGAAGFDLVARTDCDIAPGTRAMIRVGFRLQLPPGTEAQVRGRSGLALKGYDAHVGTIDADYRGEVAVILMNETTEPYKVCRGQRIAQMVIYELPTVVVDFTSDLDDSSRGTGGFGSTGGHSDLNSGTDS